MGDAFGVDPHGFAALAIVTALLDSGEPGELAQQMLTGLRSLNVDTLGEVTL